MDINQLTLNLLLVILDLITLVSAGNFISIGPGVYTSNKTLSGGPRSVLVMGSCEFMHNGTLSSINFYVANADWFMLQIWRPVRNGDWNMMQLVFEQLIQPNKTMDVIQLWLEDEPIRVQEKDRIGIAKVNNTYPVPYVFNPQMSSDLWYKALSKEEPKPKLGTQLRFEELGFPYHFSITVTFRPDMPDYTDLSKSYPGIVNITRDRLYNSRRHNDSMNSHYLKDDVSAKYGKNTLSDAPVQKDYLGDSSPETQKHKSVFDNYFDPEAKFSVENDVNSKDDHQALSGTDKSVNRKGENSSVKLHQEFKGGSHVSEDEVPVLKEPLVDSNEWPPSIYTTEAAGVSNELPSGTARKDTLSAWPGPQGDTSTTANVRPVDSIGTNGDPQTMPSIDSDGDIDGPFHPSSIDAAETQPSDRTTQTPDDDTWPTHKHYSPADTATLPAHKPNSQSITVGLSTVRHSGSALYNTLSPTSSTKVLPTKERDAEDMNDSLH